MDERNNEITKLNKISSSIQSYETFFDKKLECLFLCIHKHKKLKSKQNIYTCECQGNSTASICEICIKHCHNKEGCKKLLLQSLDFTKEEDLQRKNQITCDCGRTNHQLSRVSILKEDKSCFFKDINEFCIAKEFFNWNNRDILKKGKDSKFASPNKTNIVWKELSKNYKFNIKIKVL